MSTNINIAVGDSALLDAAKQQQAANRQAQLNREASSRLEAQATAARTTALAAQGRDANGNLITGAPFTQPLIDRRPAANRDKEKIGYFWLQQTAIVVDGLQYEKLIVSSGDGSQVVEVTFENPTVASHLNITRPTLPSSSGWDDSSDYYTGNLTFLYGTTQSTNFPAGAKDYRKIDPGLCIKSPTPIILTATDGSGTNVEAFVTTSNRRLYAIYSKAAAVTRSVVLPLGNGTALFASYYVGKARWDYLTLEDTVTYTPVDLIPTTSGALSGYDVSTTASYSVSNSIVPSAQIEFEECTCFIVSRKIARQITAPPLLLEQFRSQVGTTTESPSETIYYEIPQSTNPLFPGDPCSTVDILGFGDYYTYSGSTFTHPETGVTTPGITFSVSGPSFTREGAIVLPQSEPPYCEYSEYGLTYEGESDDGFSGGTPLSWYFLDSHEAAINIANAETHEDIREITTEGVVGTVGSKLPYSKYMGLPYDIRTELLSGNVKIYKGDGSVISGPLNEANYPYGASPWGLTSSVKKSGPSPSALFSIYFIYDWDNSNFCREQAARYGITTS